MAMSLSFGCGGANNSDAVNNPSDVAEPEANEDVQSEDEYVENSADVGGWKAFFESMCECGEKGPEHASCHPDGSEEIGDTLESMRQASEAEQREWLSEALAAEGMEGCPYLTDLTFLKP